MPGICQKAFSVICEEHNENNANDACNVGELLTTFCQSLQSEFDEEKGIMAASTRLGGGERIELLSIHMFAEFGPLR